MSKYFICNELSIQSFYPYYIPLVTLSYISYLFSHFSFIIILLPYIHYIAFFLLNYVLLFFAIFLNSIVVPVLTECVEYVRS